MKKQTCKYILEDGSTCGSIYHTAMFHKAKKPLKRTVLKMVSAYQATDSITGKRTTSWTEDKPKKFRKNKTPSKTLLKKKLEKLVKDYVKKRDDYTCQRCGLVVEGANCHASHVIPVSRSGYLQFDPLNMKVLCYHDHINWWHKHPVEAGKWFTDTFPERWKYLEELHIKRMKPMTEVELQEKINYYKGLMEK